MDLYQDSDTILKKAQQISKQTIKFSGHCVEWILTSFLAVIIGASTGIIRVCRLLYRIRGQLIGNLLLVSLFALLLLWANQLVGFKGEASGVHKWLMSDYRWAVIATVVSLITLAAWNHVSPTLRALFGIGWSRIGFWALVGVVMLVATYMGLPQADIAYRDAYVGGAILYVVALALIARVRPPKDFKPTQPIFVEDNPMGHGGTVNYEPYETQKRAIADIKYLVENGKPSAFAISGRWGVGKTSLLALARKSLDRDKTIIWVDFEPWRYASEEALILGFYQDIGLALAKAIPGIQNIIKPLSVTTEKFIRQRDGSGVFGTVMDIAREISKPAETPDAQIRDLLTRECKRLVIVIDDVERSSNTERMFRTLQLAHYAKKINNVQVVFLWDKDVVLNARPAHFQVTPQGATEYLEKFMGREVTVPSPRTSELRQHFTVLMEAHKDKPGFDFSEGDLPEDMLSAIGTPRGIINLFNEFATFRVNLEGGDNEPR